MEAGQTEVLNSAVAIDRIARRHREAAAASLRALGLSEATAGLLWVLSDTAPCTMGEAAERLSCDRSNITLLAIQLEQAGLVERTPDPVDARRKRLHVTAEGQAAAARLRGAVATGSPLRHLTVEERTRLATLLQASLDADGPALDGADLHEASAV